MKSYYTSINHQYCTDYQHRPDRSGDIIVNLDQDGNRIIYCGDDFIKSPSFRYDPNDEIRWKEGNQNRTGEKYVKRAQDFGMTIDQFNGFWKPVSFQTYDGAVVDFRKLISEVAKTVIYLYGRASMIILESIIIAPDVWREYIRFFHRYYCYAGVREPHEEVLEWLKRRGLIMVF